jgi:hypothetical protein
MKIFRRDRPAAESADLPPSRRERAKAARPYYALNVAATRIDLWIDHAAPGGPTIRSNVFKRTPLTFTSADGRAVQLPLLAARARIERDGNGAHVVILFDPESDREISSKGTDRKGCEAFINALAMWKEAGMPGPR